MQFSEWDIYKLRWIIGINKLKQHASLNSFWITPTLFFDQQYSEECKRKREFKICCISAFLCVVEFVIGAKFNRTEPGPPPLLLDISSGIFNIFNVQKCLAQQFISFLSQLIIKIKFSSFMTATNGYLQFCCNNSYLNMRKLVNELARHTHNHENFIIIKQVCKIKMQNFISPP